MKHFFRILFLITLFFGLQFNSNEAEKVEYLKTDWSFKGPFGKFDRAALQEDIKFIKKCVPHAIL